MFHLVPDLSSVPSAVQADSLGHLFEAFKKTPAFAAFCAAVQLSGGQPGEVILRGKNQAAVLKSVRARGVHACLIRMRATRISTSAATDAF